MKTLRVFFIRCFLINALVVLMGCATTEHYETEGQSTQDNQWDDLTAAQKVGTCLWWPFQFGLLVGGSALGHGAPQSN
jgi:hypothetical protein